MWSNGALLWRRIDQNYYRAQVVECGEPELNNAITEIRYVDDNKVERDVPIDDLFQEVRFHAISINHTFDELPSKDFIRRFFIFVNRYPSRRPQALAMK
jgi:hypothetical protein